MYPYMLHRFILFFALITLFGSCSEPKKEKEVKEEPIEQEESLEESLKNAKAPVATVDSVELNKSLKKIEAKYGEQWDFCNCVVKGDSINKAFLKPNLPDKEFERLSNRFDEIDEKCQAFRIQDANRTPEERAIHEKKVKKCLKAAKVKAK
jgi:tetrahydromethanopterin S-methyltransferase subunit G